VNGPSVPASASAATASTGPGRDGTAGAPSVTAVKAAAPSAAPRNCTAVTAIGSRPASSRPCATVNVADSTSETSTSPSPRALAPPAPPPPVTRPTPPSEIAKPSHAAGRATARCHTAAMTATSTGAAPISSAAWVTLVRAIPAFCTMTDPPYPTAPEARTLTSKARPPPRRSRPRQPPRRATGSSTAAARPKRTAVSQPGASHCRASLDSGTVVPHSSPAAMRAATALRRLVFMNSMLAIGHTEFASRGLLVI
jgi:hypothetical protein